MACTCQNFPCTCGEESVSHTKCDLYRPGQPNVWVERSPADESAPGVCLLDTMTPEQVIYTVERDETARADLLRVTSDPALREIANTVPRLPVVEQEDAEQALLNRPRDQCAMPYYTMFRGQPPFVQ